MGQTNQNFTGQQIDLFRTSSNLCKYKIIVSSFRLCAYHSRFSLFKKKNQEKEVMANNYNVPFSKEKIHY